MAPCIPNRTVSSGAIAPATGRVRGQRGSALHRHHQDHAHRGRGSRTARRRSKEQRINGIVLDLFGTGAGLWYGPNTIDVDEYAVRSSSDAMDAPIAPVHRADPIGWPGRVKYEKGTQNGRAAPASRSLHREGAAAAAARL